MLKDILGILFDFGGTLNDYTPLCTFVWSKIAKQLGVEISPDDPRIREGIRQQQAARVELGIPESRITREEFHSLNCHVLDAICIDYRRVRQGRLMKVIEKEFDGSFQSEQIFSCTLAPEKPLKGYIQRVSGLACYPIAPQG